MTCLTLNISKTNIDDFSLLPQKYPETNTGTFVIAQKLNEPDYILYEVDHGTPNSDTLRNIETGLETQKDINEIDSKYDYIILDKKSKLVLSSSGVSVKDFQNMLATILGNAEIRIEPFYSKEEVINQIQNLAEITFYTKPENPMFGIEDDLIKAIKGTHLIDAANDKIKEISMSIKFAGLKLNAKNKSQIRKMLTNSAYKSVSIKADNDKFTNIINTNSVTTKIRLQNQVVKNGRLSIEDFKAEYSKINLDKEIGAVHV